MAAAYSKVWRKVSDIIDSGISPLVLLKKLNEIEGVQNPDKEMEQFIIDISCDYYRVKSEDILTPDYLSDKETQSRDMIIVLMLTHLPAYSIKKIAEICKKSHTVISLVKKAFSQMGTKVKHEREFLEIFEDLSIQIKGFKEAQEQN